jgi:hypothetical protein
MFVSQRFNSSNSMPGLARTTVLCALLALTACASGQVGTQGGKDGAGMPQRMGEAVTSPLKDFNLTSEAIPDVLKEAAAAPYGLPSDLSCASLITQVQSLDGVLGADLDAPVTSNNPSLLERGVGEVGNASVSALRSTAEGIVPFRGWVRKLTGAERHSRKVAAAITAGAVRRAYLKGQAQARGCAAPATAAPASAVVTSR